MVVDQKFACHEFPKNAHVRAATSEFTDFSSVWWIEHGKKNPIIPTNLGCFETDHEG